MPTTRTMPTRRRTGGRTGHGPEVEATDPRRPAARTDAGDRAPRGRAAAGTTARTTGRSGGRTAARNDVAELWVAYREEPSTEHRDRLIEHYMRKHVRPIAERLHARLPDQVDVEDLVQEGYMGLIESIRRFDPERKIKFETFSSQRINGAMRDYLRRLDSVPRLARQRERRLQTTLEDFRKGAGRAPCDDELGERLEMDGDKLRELFASGRAPAVLHFSNPRSGMETEDGDDFDGVRVLEDRRSPHGGSPLASAERSDLRDFVVDGLARRDQLIVILYYYEQMTMKEVGEVLGICESRVSQRIEAILGHLRDRFSDPADEELFRFSA